MGELDNNKLPPRAPNKALNPKMPPKQPPKPVQAPSKPAKAEILKQPPKPAQAPQKPVQAPKQPPKPIEPKKTDKPSKPKEVEQLKAEPLKPKKPEKQSDGSVVEAKKAPQKPENVKNEGKSKEGAVDDKNLKVVEKALSVEELNQRKQRRIRNATYTMSALVLLLAIVLIIIIFWPAEQKVEARYDLTFDNIPAVTQIEHSIYSEEVTGNIVTFKKSITIENPINSYFTGYACFAMSVKFMDNTGVDISNQMYLRLDENNASDIFNLENIKQATQGEIEGLPNHQIYVDLISNNYIYFNNVLARGDEPYSLILGFLCKNQELLKNEIKMIVTIYGFDANNLSLKTTSSGMQITASNGQTIPAEQEWVDKVKQNLIERS